MSKIINKERMMEMKKEEKYYQIYRIHLLNGEPYSDQTEAV